MGHAWLVKDIKMVENADQEYLSLAATDLRSVAVVNNNFAEMVTGDMKHPEVTGKVDLTSYKPNHMTYQVTAGQKSLVVFSEVYYGDSWQAYIDGKPVPHLRANYILRALPVDPGTHTVEFKFTFKPFEKGEKISLAGSILVLFLLLGSAIYAVYTMLRKPEEAS